MRGEQPRALQIVGDGVIHRDDARLADVDADHRAVATASRCTQAADDRVGADVVEAHPVDDGAIGDQAEQPRSRVARLRLRGHRADLDVPEPEQAEAPDAAGVLVESGRDTERGRELDAERADDQPRIGSRERLHEWADHRRAP